MNEKAPDSRGFAVAPVLWALAILGVITFTLASLLAAEERRQQRRALLNETLMLLNAVRVYQSDFAAALSSYNTLAEVGWPDAANRCADALTVLANAGYIAPSAHYTATTASLADGRVRWTTSCGPDVGRFSLQLSSFGNDPVCSAAPAQLAAACPEEDVAFLLAARSGGEARLEDVTDPLLDGPSATFTTNNRYVHWAIYRGAAHAALQRALAEVLWQNYTGGTSAGIPFPISARSGLRLGPTPRLSPEVFASYLMGANPGITTPLDSSDDLPPIPDQSPVSALDTLDGRSFAVFYRGARIDVFGDTTPAFTLTAGACAAGATPVWGAGVETLQLGFRGFDAASLMSLTVQLDTSSGDDQETLIPVAWQVYDAGSALEYEPEIRIDVITVLPAITNMTAGATTVSCTPAVIQGTVDSASGGLTFGSGTLVRNCIDDNTQTSAPQSQTLPTIPRAQIASWRAGGNTRPAVRISVYGYCATSTDI